MLVNRSPSNSVHVSGSKLVLQGTFISALLSGALSWGIYVGTTSAFWALVVFASTLTYCAVRSYRDWNGWYFKEVSGVLYWFVGWKSKSLSIDSIVRIGFSGMATLKTGENIQLPLPNIDFFPVYLHLFNKYSELFEAPPEPVYSRFPF